MGAGLLLDLTAVVGPGTDWTPLVVGDTPVGVDALLDMPRVGARLGETVLSSGVRGDGVRVG